MTKPTIKLQDLQARIGHRAKSAPAHRFWGLHVHIKKLETLSAAYLEAKRNKGAPGSDGLTFKHIEMTGRGAFVTEIADALRQGHVQISTVPQTRNSKGQRQNPHHINPDNQGPGGAWLAEAHFGAHLRG